MLKTFQVLFAKERDGRIVLLP